ESGPRGVGAQVALDVGGVHDLCQPRQRRVGAEVVVVDEDLERAQAVAVVVAGAGGIEAVGALRLGNVENVFSGRVEDLGLGVDEPPDQPGAGDAVGLRTGAGDPLHGCPPVGSVAVSASAP